MDKGTIENLENYIVYRKIFLFIMCRVCGQEEVCSLITENEITIVLYFVEILE